MKISEIKNKLDKGKTLLSEYSMLDAMVKSMLRTKKEHPEELNFEEWYFQNVTSRMIFIKNELNKLFR